MNESTFLSQNISRRKRDSIKHLLCIIVAQILPDTKNITFNSGCQIISSNVYSKITQNVKIAVFPNFEAL